MKHLPSLSCALLLALIPLSFAPKALAEEPSKEPLPVKVFKNLQASRKQTVIVYGTSLTINGAWTTALKEYFEKYQKMVPDGIRQVISQVSFP